MKTSRRDSSCVSPSQANRLSVGCFVLAVLLSGATSRLRGAPVPDAEAVKEAGKLVREVFKSDFDKAKTPADQVALAKTLLKQADESRDDDASRYVLLREAVELGTKAGDAQLALETIGILADEFDVQEGDLRLTALEKLGTTAKLPAAQKVLAEAAIAALEEALSNDEFESARKLLALARGFSAKARDVALAKEIIGLSKDVELQAKAGKDAEEAIKALAANPQDLNASLALGKYYALVKGDWKKGLPLLAAGSDAELASLAKSEIPPPADASAQVTLADGWWSLAKKPGAKGAAQIEAHAIYWYERALPHLSGLPKAKVEQRLKEASKEALATVDQGSGRQATDGGKGAPAVNARKLVPGLLVTPYARVKAQDAEGGAFVEPADLGNPVGATYVTRTLFQWKYPETQNAVAVGYLKVDKAGEYAFTTNNFYDRNALWVNGELVCPYRDHEKVSRITLEKGFVPIVSAGYVEARGSVEVKWQPPGQPELSAIPPDLLFFMPTAPGKRGK